MPADPTPAQSEAARQNGHASQGPVTPEGKAAGRLNAAKHGLSSSEFLLRPGEVERLEALTADFCRRFHAQGPVMLELAQALARHVILRHRLDELEIAALNIHLGRSLMDDEELAGYVDPKLPSLATLVRYRARLDRSERELWDQLEALQVKARQDAEAAQAPVQSPTAHFGTNEPKPQPASTPNRHERRRLEAMKRTRHAA